jgi:class 3 adenylate cyclase/tetratricopeptide (TPR) repeat protein
MQCPRCQNEVPAGSKFCNSCGARLDAACPQCGHSNVPGSRFCAECGQALGAVSSPAPTPTPASPEAYTPKHLAERILTSRGALEGERKQVTVLFADLKGSMELLADRDPEEAREILDPVLERMMEAVHHYEGTVNQVMGDGIMALFGAPLAHEDHAVRACYAALRMQEAVQQYADAVWRAQSVRIQIRVGLNSGEVVVRSIGSDLHMDYTAVGQTTHLAARMEQLAAPGTILLAPDALQLAEGYVQVKSLGPVQVKGLSEPVDVYELLGVGTARSRLQAAAARGLTRFVGRDAELDTLRRTLEQAGAGHGQIVALVGEAGVGKSRLVWEFGHSHRAQGWLVLESGSVSYGKATSYLPVIDLLKSYCGIEDRDDPRRIREKLTGKLLSLDPALQSMLPPLLALLDVPADDPAWQALDPPQRRQRTLDAAKRLLLRESQEQPLLLVFEDLHWIDAETQALLDSLVDSLPTARVLLLVNYRPEYEHTWHRKTYYQQLRLDPLPPASAEQLLDALLGDDSSLRPVRQPLIERTEGNPFFVEESVRSLVEARVLAGQRGAYVLARPFESAQVPSTVQAVLAARIDRLAPEDKHLLQAAAVIGKDVPYPLLQAIAELPEPALREGLARLQAAEFLYETSLFPDLEYTFKHALTHEVAYGGILQEQRRARHAQIVEAIEALYAGRQAEQVERLAHHAYRGEVWHKAGGYLQQAGEKSLGRSAHREAVAYFEQALLALDRLPDSREKLEQAIDVRLGLRDAFLRLGEHRRIIDELREAESGAERLNDQGRLARVLAAKTVGFFAIGDQERAIESAERALSIGLALQSPILQLEINGNLALAHYTAGNYRRAIEIASNAAASLTDDVRYERGTLSHVPSAISLAALATSLAECGDFARTAALGTEAIRIAEAVDEPLTFVIVNARMSEIQFLKGDVHEAIHYLERAREPCERIDLPVFLDVIDCGLGYAYALLGQVSEALPLLERGVERAPSSDRATRLGEGYLLAGRPEEASRAASHALELTRSHKERGNEARALRLLGEVAARAEPPDVERAEGYYRQALARAEELGMRPLVAHCHRGLGTLYQKSGRVEAARAELTAAVDLYRAMAMTFWLGPAEAALAQVSG